MSLAERPLREDLVTQACLEAYGAIRHEGRLSDRALDFTLRHKRHLYSNERRAVAERVYALLRRQRTVDALLERSCGGFGSLPTARQDLLRLGASRTLHGEAAERVARQLALSGADEAALLGLSRAAEGLDALPRRERFAIAASLPDFLAERFLAELGERAEVEAEAMNERAPLTARVNPHKANREGLLERLAKEGVEAEPTPLSPFGVFLKTRQNAFSMPAFKEGWFELQDEGSQLLGLLVDPPPTKVVDACAGAGGKTLQLSPAMKNRGELFALDIDERRLEDLKLRARRAGAHNVRIRTIPSEGEPAREAVKDLAGRMDRVLVDAPCSGTGTFRRKPDGRYRLSEESLKTFVARQNELLDRFSELVKPGGQMIYGTCSVLREENESVVEAFLSSHPEFSKVPAETRLTPAMGAEKAAEVCRDGFLRLFPAKHGTDGFFGAILKRAAASGS
jgi:16S rRNA (cytosine967-C5)-methyltransferase